MQRLKQAFEVVVMVAMLVAASLVIWRQLAPSSASPSRPRVEDARGTIPADLVTTTRGLGELVLVEFADFQCPFCGKHAREVEPLLQKTFIDTGMVRHVFINYPLANHPRAIPASESAFCAGEQSQFWPMYHSLFQEASSLEDRDLRERARGLGLNLEQFERCINDSETKAAIERHKSIGRSVGVQSTPSFFLGTVEADGSIRLKKRLNGALPFSDFHAAITSLMSPELKSRIDTVAVSGGAVAPSTRPN